MPPSLSPYVSPFIWDDWEGYFRWCAALSFHDIGSPRTRWSSAMPPSSFGPSLVILGRFSSSAWALGLILKWVRAPRSFGPTIAPQNPAVRILGREEGFDVLGVPHRLVKSCHLLAFRAFSFAQDTFLALRYPKRVFIMGAKNRAVTLIGGINTHSKGPIILLLHPRALAHIP